MSERRQRKRGRRRSVSARAERRAGGRGASRGASQRSAPANGGALSGLGGDISPVQRFVSLAVAAVLSVAAVLTSGDVRALLVVAAVVAALPVLVVVLISSSPDWGENEAARPMSRSVARWACLGVAAGLAATGVTWYGLAPGVASYQLGIALILPLLGIGLWWLHRHLPTRGQWVLAMAVAPIGPVGYLIFGGSEWWAAYGLTVLPLAVLIASRMPRSPTAPPGSLPGWIDGPWGPP